jgi:hypothetical protein
VGEAPSFGLPPRRGTGIVVSRIEFKQHSVAALGPNHPIDLLTRLDWNTGVVLSIGRHLDHAGVPLLNALSNDRMVSQALSEAQGHICTAYRPFWSVRMSYSGFSDSEYAERWLYGKSAIFTLLAGFPSGQNTIPETGPPAGGGGSGVPVATG